MDRKLSKCLTSQKTEVWVRSQELPFFFSKSYYSRLIYCVPYVTMWNDLQWRLKQPAHTEQFQKSHRTSTCEWDTATPVTICNKRQTGRPVAASQWCWIRPADTEFAKSVSVCCISSSISGQMWMLYLLLESELKQGQQEEGSKTSRGALGCVKEDKTHTLIAAAIFQTLLCCRLSLVVAALHRQSGHLSHWMTTDHRFNLDSSACFSVKNLSLGSPKTKSEALKPSPYFWFACLCSATACGLYRLSLVPFFLDCFSTWEGNLKEDPGHAAGTTSLSWTGNAYRERSLDLSSSTAPATRPRITVNNG